MSTGMVKLIKQAAMEAVDNSKPCDLKFGTVISEEPLNIRITNQFILPESTLIVPEHLTKYETHVTVKPEYNWITKDTENKVELSEVEPHAHDIEFKEKKIQIHNELRLYDRVVLIRMQGGQYYYVAGRIERGPR